MARFEMTANQVTVLNPRIPDESIILRFMSGHGVYADILLSLRMFTELRDKLREAEKLLGLLEAEG